MYQKRRLTVFSSAVLFLSATFAALLVDAGVVKVAGKAPTYGWAVRTRGLSGAHASGDEDKNHINVRFRDEEGGNQKDSDGLRVMVLVGGRRGARREAGVVKGENTTEDVIEQTTPSSISIAATRAIETLHVLKTLLRELQGARNGTPRTAGRRDQCGRQTSTARPSTPQAHRHHSRWVWSDWKPHAVLSRARFPLPVILRRATRSAVCAGDRNVRRLWLSSAP
ncbi:hypothetical protein CC80DRAFT_511553 [Byssothecium circinans]|uniref:Uncharacterized protein n=1 Tax=Byssothecium circinans TaxID=147558 RepID=A0A6A5T7Q9_9PLEO|nr:hypothetical protein CC80DRAFT_511553 [Byssothecium circinans]